MTSLMTAPFGMYVVLGDATENATTVGREGGVEFPNRPVFRLTMRDGRPATLMVIEGTGDTKLTHPDGDSLVIDLAALWLQSPFS